MTRQFSPDTTSGLEGSPVPTGHAYITEMFSGIQGEGPYVGVRQVFVRLAGCDLRCSWCDTPDSLVRRGPARIETRPASREFIQVQNPVSMDRAVDLLSGLRPSEHDSVTFTGGEPLLQPEAIRSLGASVRALGGRTWLETHGGRIAELDDVVDLIDVVSMDIKLPSSSGDFVPLEIHHRFLEVASNTDVYVKIVITPQTLDDEVIAAAEMLSSVSSGIILVLQQVTPFGRIKDSPRPAHMLELQRSCMRVHPSVRVIPQVHKLTGQL